MEYCDIEIKVNGEVIKTLNNFEVSKRAELELLYNNIDVISLADLQERIWFELEYDKLCDTSVTDFYDCDNVDELIEFVDKWVCEAFISCLINYRAKKYKVASL